MHPIICFIYFIGLHLFFVKNNISQAFIILFLKSNIIMSAVLAKLDKSKLDLSRTQSYSTSVGKICGILVLLILILSFTYKMVGVYNRDTIYINSFVTNDRSQVSFNDSNVTILVQDLSGNRVNAENQFQFGINVTVIESIRTINSSHDTQFPGIDQQRIDDYLSTLNQQGKGYEQIQLRTKLSSFIFQNSKLDDFQGEDLQTIIHPLVSCFNSSRFCFPKDLNVSLAGNALNRDHLVKDYQIRIDPCNKADPRCKPMDMFWYLVIFQFTRRNFNIYEPHTGDIIHDEDMPLPYLTFISEQYKKFEVITYKIKAISIKTHEQTILPSIISSLLPQEQRQTSSLFWYYDQQNSKQEHDRSSVEKSFLRINFCRSGKSQSYERRFKNFDDILGYIVGLSSAIGLIVGCCLNGYVRWSCDNFIVEQIKKQQEQEDQDKNPNDIKQKYKNPNYSGFRQLCSYFYENWICFICRCCFSSKFNKEERQTILEQANSSISMIHLTKILKKQQQELRLLRNQVSSLKNKTKGQQKQYDLQNIPEEISKSETLQRTQKQKQSIISSNDKQSESQFELNRSLLEKQ